MVALPPGDAAGPEGGRSATPSGSPRARDQAMSEVGRAGREIAIVEDDQDLLSLMSMLVKNLGHHVYFQARDGNEIVRAISEDKISPEVVLMDYRMPIMNGIQAAQEILRVKPETKVIIVTADDSAKAEAMASGLHFLQKPFSSSELSRAIEDVMHES
jgi:DNA-binding NtrC family response regulator